ncbi:MAG: HPF/RaiA family ribosome-associated protein [Thermodesulfobacteriota bacterium]
MMIVEPFHESPFDLIEKKYFFFLFVSNVFWPYSVHYKPRTLGRECDMYLEVNNNQAGMDEEATRRAERLLRFSLSRFNGTVSRVTVTFSDMNGPKGGLDKRCRMCAKMKGTGQVLAENDGYDCIEALSHCLEKLVRAIRRTVEMRRVGPIRKNRISKRRDVDKLR